jgi:hypothetical protein
MLEGNSWKCWMLSVLGSSDTGGGDVADTGMDVLHGMLSARVGGFTWLT